MLKIIRIGGIIKKVILMRCKLYFARTDFLKNCDFYKKAYMSVSPERREKADRLALSDDRRRCIGAGLLLGLALKQNGVLPENAETGLNSHGKPYLKENRLFFNLSHSGEYVLCAVGDKELGCDIEKIRDADFKIAERFFSEDENKMLNAVSEKKPKTELFFRIWTLKESYVKAVGKGLAHPFSKAELTFKEGKVTAEKGEYTFFETDIVSGYKCAACIKDKKAEFTAEEIDLKEILK